MAESRRKLDSKKYQKEDEVDEEAQKKGLRIKLAIILGAMIVIVVGMFYLSHFLSGR